MEKKEKEVMNEKFFFFLVQDQESFVQTKKGARSFHCIRIFFPIENIEWTQSKTIPFLPLKIE